MREPLLSEHVSVAPVRVGRRTFVGMAAAPALVMAGGAGPALCRALAVPPVTASADDRWTRARAIVASGALGTLRWVEVRYPAASRLTSAEWPAHLGPVLAAIDAPAPTRASALGSTSPTLVLEFEAAPPVFLAPWRSTPGSGGQVVVRGSRASLVVGVDALWLRAEGEAGTGDRGTPGPGEPGARAR